MVSDKDRKALARHRMTVPHAAIRDELGFKTVTQVRAAIRRALAEETAQRDAADGDATDLSRLELMYRAVYPQAAKGDLKAVDACLKLQAEMARLRNLDGPESGLVAAFDEALEALNVTNMDGAAIQTGRTVAAQIDEAIMYGTPLERTKALYLVPHLMNVLKELGATPAARADIAAKSNTGGEASGGKLEALRNGVGFKAFRGESIA